MAPGWWGTFAVFIQTNTFCSLLTWKHVKVDSNLNYMLTYALHHRDCFPAASKNLVSSWQRLQILKQEWFDRQKPKHKPVCLILCLCPGVCEVELPENSSELRSRKSGGTTLRSLSCFSQYSWTLWGRERCPAERGNTSAMECPQSFHPQHHADLPSSNRAKEASHAHTWLYTQWWRKGLDHSCWTWHTRNTAHTCCLQMLWWRYHSSHQPDALSNISKLSLLGTAPEGGCKVRADEKKQLFILCQSELYWDKPTVMPPAGIGLHILKPRRFWL